MLEATSLYCHLSTPLPPGSGNERTWAGASQERGLASQLCIAVQKSSLKPPGWSWKVR